ncbi:RING zinc finger protein, putative [Plasmodium malariae]|uniref:RING zinc finger protein, putative n=1 Tax=Plasmodium malariae TaxID=5858 RepID=A0A1C3KCM8_PLAMA|nr:RING zinc finger protein, putative [Plasmodium malariae]
MNEQEEETNSDLEKEEGSTKKEDTKKIDSNQNISICNDKKQDEVGKMVSEVKKKKDRDQASQNDNTNTYDNMSELSNTYEDAKENESEILNKNINNGNINMENISVNNINMYIINRGATNGVSTNGVTTNDEKCANWGDKDHMVEILGQGEAKSNVLRNRFLKQKGGTNKDSNNDGNNSSGRKGRGENDLADVCASINNSSSSNRGERGEQSNTNAEQIPSDMECAICMKLLIIPVTIPCGHNFCRDCLEKAKEYKNSCPLCRSPMGDKKNINILLSELIKEKYPLTYAKRLEEIEILKREQEKKIWKERIDAIKNSSIIPVFKVPLAFGPYFPGEVFDINIYNKKFIDLIELISNEGTFAIASPCKDKNDDDKMYGIHVKILEQNSTNQFFNIKCVANFRVILYNIIHFHQYENYIAHHSPLFDENVRVKLLEYSLLGVIPLSSSVANSTDDDKDCMPRRDNIIDVGKERVKALKNLLNTIEVEDDINAISSYYDEYKNIMNSADDSITEYINLYNAVKYYSCVIFSRICLLCIKYQLNRFGNAGIRLFNSKFRNIKLTSSEPSNEELENFSYSLSSAIISRSILKWRWFTMTNTSERLESITQYFLKKKNKSILALDNSRSPLIHRLFMLDSISSSLLIIFFIIVIICLKYFFH